MTTDPRKTITPEEAADLIDDAAMKLGEVAVTLAHASGGLRSLRAGIVLGMHAMLARQQKPLLEQARLIREQEWPE